jgi:TIR domain
MAEVFVSYSQKDRLAVERIAARLRALGLSVWYDARLESGDSFDAIIAAELRACKAVLVCWSLDAISSKWVRSEALFGYDKHKLAATFLTSCELTPPFNLVHAIDLMTWTGEPGHAGWLGITRGLGKICERPGVGALAEAMAEGSPERLKVWARHYPEEPLAKEMWASRESALRMEFAADLKAAHTQLAELLQKRRVEAEASLALSAAEFESWLDAERNGKQAMRPNPGAIIAKLSGTPGILYASPQVSVAKFSAMPGDTRDVRPSRKQGSVVYSTPSGETAAPRARDRDDLERSVELKAAQPKYFRDLKWRDLPFILGLIGIIIVIIVALLSK